MYNDNHLSIFLNKMFEQNLKSSFGTSVQSQLSSQALTRFSPLKLNFLQSIKTYKLHKWGLI